MLDAGADFIAHSVRDADVDDALDRDAQAARRLRCPTLMREVSTFVYESTPAFFSDPLFLKHADPQTIAALQGAGAPGGDAQQQDARSATRRRSTSPSRNLKKLSDAGVTIAMGTDTGPPARFQGYFELMELELMAKAGLTPKQVLAVGDARRRALHEDRRRGRHARGRQVGRLRRARRRSARRHHEHRKISAV